MTPQEWRCSRLRSSPPPTEPRRTSYTPAPADESFPEEEEEDDWGPPARSVVGTPRGTPARPLGQDGCGEPVPVPRRWGRWASLVWPQEGTSWERRGSVEQSHLRRLRRGKGTLAGGHSRGKGVRLERQPGRPSPHLVFSCSQTLRARTHTLPTWPRWSWPPAVALGSWLQAPALGWGRGGFCGEFRCSCGKHTRWRNAGPRAAPATSFPRLCFGRAVPSA